MKNGKRKALTVQNPIPPQHLGRYRRKKGVYLIRISRTGEVIYIGSSKSDVYKAISRLFQNKGILSHLDRRKLVFEVITTKLLFRNLETVLKRYYQPEYNKRIRPINDQTSYEKSHYKRLLEAFLDQSRVVENVQGDHKTDSKPTKNHEKRS